MQSIRYEFPKNLILAVGKPLRIGDQGIKVEKITKGDLQKKLEYLNLDLDKIPGDLLDHEPLNFNVSRLNNDKDHHKFRLLRFEPNLKVRCYHCTHN